MTLGLPFKESDRSYQSGDKKGQNILVPDIKSKNDIPSEVTKYFDCCIKFLEDFVGKENIVWLKFIMMKILLIYKLISYLLLMKLKENVIKRDSAGNLIKEMVRQYYSEIKIIKLYMNLLKVTS